MNKKYVTFIVPGKPKSKGRPRFVRSTGHVYTPRTTLEYEEFVKLCYEKKYKGFKFNFGLPLFVHIKAYFKQTIKKSKAIIKDEYHITKPDIDNIIKIVLDSLNGVAYADDSCVAKIQCEKIYCNESAQLEITIYVIE